MKRLSYVGGGWFRDPTVPKGETAEIVHGDAVVQPLYDLLEGLHRRLKGALCAGVERWPEYLELRAMATPPPSAPEGT